MSKSYKQTGNTSSAPRPAPAQPKPVPPPPIVHQGSIPARPANQNPWGGKR